MNAAAAGDPRALVRIAVAQAGDAIAAVRLDQMGDPTPCSELDVRALLRHIVHDLLLVVVIGRGDDTFSGTDAGALADDAWPQVWAETSAAFEDAWADDAALERVVELPWSRHSGGETLLALMSSIVIHTWDLATATGQTLEWDDAVVTAADAALRADLASEGRDDTAIPFAAVVDVPATAPRIDRLVAWGGRQP